MNIPAPLSKNQKEYFDRSFRSWFNVAEGGKRGGKNVLNTLAFCARLEMHPAKLHLVSGVSTATANLNVIDCDGYGVENYFSGRCRKGVYKNRDCLYVKTPVGEKVILISGGGKNGDEKLIKGNTYGMAYVTEANECTETFLKEVFDRTLSSSDRAVYHDLNPKGAGHWYYKMLEYHEQKQREDPEYGYNYGHFTIADNMSISDEQLKKILSTYDRKSIWFTRDILGLRRNPEGVIYDCFSDENLYDELEPVILHNASRMISIDYGTTNPMRFLEIYDDGENTWVENEYNWDSRRERRQKTDREYADNFLEFMGKWCGAIVDPSAASFIAELRSRGAYVVPADNDVLNGIRKTASLIEKRKIKINKNNCPALLEEMGVYSWDMKAAEHGVEKPVKEYDHSLDALRYYVNYLPGWRTETWR